MVLLFLEKNFFFVLGVVHGDPIFAKIGPTNGNFRGFSRNFSELIFIIIIIYLQLGVWDLKTGFALIEPKRLTKP